MQVWKRIKILIGSPINQKPFIFVGHVHPIKYHHKMAIINKLLNLKLLTCCIYIYCWLYILNIPFFKPRFCWFYLPTFLVPQQQNFAMGSSAEISSGAIRCSFNTRFRTRFRRVPVQVPREVPEGSGEDTCWGCGSGGCRYLLRFRRVPVQVEGYGADIWVLVQLPDEILEGL